MIDCQFTADSCLNLEFAAIAATKISNQVRNVQSVMVICELTNRIDMNGDDFTALSVFAGFMVVLWAVGMRMLYSEIRHQVDLINLQSPELELNDEIKQALYDLMHMALDDTVGNIQMPTAMDHLMGFGAQFLQRKFLSDVPPNIIEGVATLAAHGQEERQEENAA